MKTFLCYRLFHLKEIALRILWIILKVVCGDQLTCRQKAAVGEEHRSDSSSVLLRGSCRMLLGFFTTGLLLHLKTASAIFEVLFCFFVIYLQ